MKSTRSAIQESTRFWSSYKTIVPVIPLPLVRKILTQCINFGNSYLLLHRFLFAS